MFTNSSSHYPQVQNGETFTFEYGVAAYLCEERWQAIKPVFDAWARMVGLRYIFETHQRIYIPHHQPDYDDLMFAFKLRWC